MMEKDEFHSYFCFKNPSALAYNFFKVATQEKVDDWLRLL